MIHKQTEEVPGRSDLQACLKAEIAEMDRFKWFLGERLGHDPLQDRSLNAIYIEWIESFGAAFREKWEQTRKNGGPLSMIRGR